VPRDAAFCFYYEENLRVLEALGAEVVPFRPVEGDGVPPGTDALYLGGGYPEVHAARLARNEAFLEGVRGLHAEGKPLYAECGGFMVLCRALEDLEGRTHPMAGIFPTEARMTGRPFRLGYREVRAEGLPPLEGAVARGHEFHYSHVAEMPARVPRVYRVRNARGEELPPEGYREGSALGSYIHLHFASNPEFARGVLGL
jgi:cobyrinic acid a,c-diamide synthase